jgi:NADH-quinone oxidoreductase subunit E
LLPALYVAQGEVGYLPDEALHEVAKLLDLPPADVAATASFYTMFYRQPVGKRIIRVCTNLSCKLRGADRVAQRLTERLGVGHNGTTPDGEYTLEFVECLGACDKAPVILVNETLHAHVTENQIDDLLDGHRPPENG